VRVVLLGGAPGVGKSAVGRALLFKVMLGERLVQWVDVDALWLHQPWRVDDQTKTMVQENLRCVMANAAAGGVDTLVITWVFQGPEMHALVEGLAPTGAEILRVQLVADEAPWRARFEADVERPPLNDFFIDRYRAAQLTPVDHRVDVSGDDPSVAAGVLAALLFPT